MKFVVLACLAAYVAADRLENNYLPPRSAAGAGGNDNILVAPAVNQQFSGKAPSASDIAAAKPIAILRYDNKIEGDGSYSYGFDTENKINVQESGQLKNAGTDQEAISVQGSYSYEGPDGKIYTVTYVADENGFQAVGDHLPTPPPTPVEILKSLEQNAAEEAAAAANVQPSTASSQGYKY